MTSRRSAGVKGEVGGDYNDNIEDKNNNGK